MSEREYIHIWPGERRLLPTNNQHCIYELRCVRGKGFIRLMSQSHRDSFSKDNSLIVPGGEVATVSGEEYLVVEIASTEKVLE